MLLTKEVEVTCLSNNKKYIESLGHKWEYKKVITINVHKLLDGSNAPIQCLCDYCLEQEIETVISKPYYRYINSHKNQPIIKDACDKCKHKKQEELCLIKNGVRYSPQINGVGSKIAVAKTKYNINGIDEEFNERDLVLLTKTYKNAESYMDFICNKHIEKGVQSIKYGNFKYKDQDCKYCSWDKLSKDKRRDFSEVQDLFKDKKVILLSKEEDYINNQSPLEYECPIHKGIIQTKTYEAMLHSYGCNLCSYDMHKGENNPMWKGGFSEINSILRDSITEWKKESMIASNYKCVVTNKRFDIIHHLYGFDKIFNEIFDNLNIEKRRFINEYSDEELVLIRNECSRLHKIHGVGVCLTGDIHALFHKVYGYGENNIEQFNEFKENYIGGKYKDLEEVG